MRPMPPSHLPLLAAWLLTVLPALAAAKIVFLNGTEVFRVGNGTTPAPIKWFQPRNISNHSGAKTEAVIRKSDAEEQVEEQRLEAPLVTRNTAMLSSLRGIWSDLSPILTVLSTILGIFLMFVIVESPLSPLPVPPLPHSPVGPYPPTNMYPFGIPPHRSHYDVGGYAGPQSHTSYRIPRQMRNMNDTMKEMMEFFEKQIAKPIGGLQVNDMLETIRTMWQPALQKCVQLLTDRLSQFVSHNGIQANEREMMKNPQKSS